MHKEIAFLIFDNNIIKYYINGILFKYNLFINLILTSIKLIKII